MRKQARRNMGIDWTGYSGSRDYRTPARADDCPSIRQHPNMLPLLEAQWLPLLHAQTLHPMEVACSGTVNSRDIGWKFPAKPPMHVGWVRNRAALQWRSPCLCSHGLSVPAFHALSLQATFPISTPYNPHSGV